MTALATSVAGTRPCLGAFIHIAALILRAGVWVRVRFRVRVGFRVGIGVWVWVKVSVGA